MTTRLGPRPRSDGTLDEGDLRLSARHAGVQLRVLVLMPWAACQLRCRMCDIWKDRSAARLEPGSVAAEAAAWRAAGLERVLLSGGEPLLHPDLWSMTAPLLAEGIGLSLLAGGPALAEEAEAIVERVDDLVVSLDGPPELHDRIRGVPGAFAMLAEGVARIHALAPDLSIGARCTVQQGNHDQLTAVLRTARELGLRRLSFLAVDLHSDAFNRPGGGSSRQKQALALDARQVEALAREVEALAADPVARAFVTESPAKLRAQLVERFRAESLGLMPPPAACNAPRVSAVIEADGRVRPCFFHAPVGRWPRDGSLLEILAAGPSRRFLDAFDPRRNPICRRCVCRLNLAVPADAGVV